MQTAIVGELDILKIKGFRAAWAIGGQPGGFQPGPGGQRHRSTRPRRFAFAGAVSRQKRAELQRFAASAERSSNTEPARLRPPPQRDAANQGLGHRNFRTGNESLCGLSTSAAIPPAQPAAEIAAVVKTCFSDFKVILEQNRTPGVQSPGGCQRRFAQMQKVAIWP